MQGREVYLAMAIYRLLQNSPLDPEEITQLVSAYEATLRALCLKDRTDPVTELVAKKVFAIRQTGVRDPARISEIAISDLDAAR